MLALIIFQAFLGISLISVLAVWASDEGYNPICGGAIGLVIVIYLAIGAAGAERFWRNRL